MSHDARVEYLFPTCERLRNASHRTCVLTQLERFRDFQYPDDVREAANPCRTLPQVTDEHRRKTLGQNSADLTGLDIDEALEDRERRVQSTAPGDG